MARATWLADVLRAAGCTVREDAGWKSRGRDDFTPQGVIVHATAGGLAQSNDSAYSVLVNGRPGLSGPISTVMIERGTGVWRPVASGASNHAKTGWAGNCKGLGNSRLIGIEAHHNNLAEPWTEQALDNYARGVAAICRKLGIGVNRVALHKEHQPGEKSDTTFSGDLFRARVARFLGGVGPSVESSGGEFLMGLTEKQQNDIAFTIAGAPNGPSHVRDAVTLQEVQALRRDFAEFLGRPAPPATLVATDAQLAELVQQLKDDDNGLPADEEMLTRALTHALSTLAARAAAGAGDKAVG